MHSIDDALRHAAATGIDRLDAGMLLLHVLGRPVHDRGWLIAHGGDPLAPADAMAHATLAARRAAGEPTAYLLGRQEFAGLDFAVDPRVLVPRPDTETLLDWSLDVLESLAAPAVLDLGTGSGALAVAIGHRRPDARVAAIDASPGALEVARANAARHGVALDAQRGDWLRGHAGRYHCIVSNPPYIAEADPHLGALAHEPRSALVAGADGLDDLRAIVAAAPGHLLAGGWLLLEHGWDQAGAVRGLLAARGFDAVASRRDIAGTERCSGGRWNNLPQSQEPTP